MKLLLGDCKNKLKELEDNSIDSIVTDPPYGISFMGKKWDYDVPQVEVWKECLRVLKPGGYLLSFAGTRTQHRMAVNIEDAGFEIRDMIAWVYGSGFPKSLNIGKAVDKIIERRDLFEPFSKHFSEQIEKSGKSQKEISALFPSKTGGLTGCVWNWANGANVPTVAQWNILKPLLNLSDEFMPLIERIEREREVVGKTNTNLTVYQNIGGTNVSGEVKITKGTSQWEGWGTALKPALEPITVARKPIEGTVAQNCLKWGVGGINIDGCRVGTSDDISIHKGAVGFEGSIGSITKESFKSNGQNLGRFPANLIHDGSDEVVGLFPQTKGATSRTDGKGVGMFASGNKDAGTIYPDSGSAARFFKTCNYSLRHDTMSVWKTTFVDTAERLLRITQVIKESIAPLNAGDLQEEQNDQLVKSAVSHADTIEILIALVLVRIKSLASNPEGLQAIQDSIGNCKECIQLLSLVLNVVNEENTDITQITTNLWTLFGSVNPAITNSTPETKKLEPKRFAYIPKASKRERNIGCEGLPLKSGGSNAKGYTEDVAKGLDRNRPVANFHPTVKPVALMEYLVKMVSREGQVVLDPFMGSGTTGMACKKLGRDFVGIEMEEEYIEIAKARIEGTDRDKPKEQLNLV